MLLFPRKMKQHRSCHLILTTPFHPCRKLLALAVGHTVLLQSPPHQQCTERSLGAMTAQAIGRGGRCAMLPMPCRNPILFLPHHQLMAAAETPHVAAFSQPAQLRAGTSDGPTSPSPFGASGLRGSCSRVPFPAWLCTEPTSNFFSKTVCTSLQFHHANCMSYYRTG